jgi:2-dehydro-3-deoxyphosphooctonate aldolase (KDO 8-P synthase)
LIASGGSSSLNLWPERTSRWGGAAVFLEVHEQPERALSDGPNALRLDRLADLIRRLSHLDALVKSWR